MSFLDLQSAKWCWVSCYLQNLVALEKTKLQRHCLDIASRNQKWLALASIAPKGQWWCLCDLEMSGFNWFNSPGAEVVTQQLQEKLNKRPFKEDWEAAIGRPQILGTRSAFQPFANLALKQNTCNDLSVFTWQFYLNQTSIPKKCSCPPRFCKTPLSKPTNARALGQHTSITVTK